MLNIDLPVWLNSGSAKKIADTFLVWWLRVQEILEIPLLEIDPRTCTISSLNILARSRGVRRFAGEPLSLYRLRVEFAFINAKDAGSSAGLQRIFERLQIGYVEIDEFIEGFDFDIIRLNVSSEQLGQNQQLLDLLIREYGRTGRSFQFEIITPITLAVSVEDFGAIYYFHEAN